MYLHEVGRDIDSFTKEDMAQGKHLLANMTNVTPDGELISSPRQTITENQYSDDSKTQKAWNTVVASESASESRSSLTTDEWPEYSLGNSYGKKTIKTNTNKKPYL